jgi:hypothetical protein
VHHLQGKTELVTALLGLLQEFYREKLTSLLRHQVAARFIAQYDVNNTYQYIINRDDTHLSWLASAISELGGMIPELSDQSRDPGAKGEAGRRLIEEDATDADAFVNRWKPRVATMTNARHARMLGVILGEELEQKRFFEQALAGRTDLLGRRSGVLEPSQGEVLPSRWIE